MSHISRIINTIVERLPSRNLVFAAFIITLGSAFQHGFYTAVFNTPHEMLRKWIAELFERKGHPDLASSELFVKILWAVGVSIYFFGGIFGTLIAGATIDKYDRKRVVFVNCGSMAIPVAIMLVAYFASVPMIFFAARFLLGINSGVFSCAVPIYLAEISPTNIRGMVCSWYHVVYASGVVAAYLVGLSESLGNHPWIISMFIPIAPLLVQMLLMQFCPVSPRFLLIKKNKYEEAMKVLKWLRRTEILHVLEDELDEISLEIEDYFMYRAVPNVHWKQLFSLSYIRKPLLISIMMMCAQQLCGVYVFIVYSSAILQNVGLPPKYADYGTLIIGILYLLTSVISMLLIEVAGRRMLMLYGYIGMFIFYLTHYLTFTYNRQKQTCVGAVAVLFTWFFIIHYALGPNSIPWFMASELFNQASRPKAVALSSCINWTICTFVAISFWPISEYIGEHTFLIYIVCQVIFFFLLAKYVPETRRKSITEITELYK